MKLKETFTAEEVAEILEKIYAKNYERHYTLHDYIHDLSEQLGFIVSYGVENIILKIPKK